jgi:hypothetical protein
MLFFASKMKMLRRGHASILGFAIETKVLGRGHADLGVED